ncbi:conjugal transfer protein [Margalitia sp. FSL K6-0131]|uniref:conjugal transfer protein n=1 Tax=Margalitia sp. FSL K6-0131 TaxID=2954604 RepID=UPI0030F5F7B8
MKNPLKFKSKTPMKAKFIKIGKYVFWIFVILTFIRGINSYFKHNEVDAKVTNEIPYIISGAAQGFASAFATDYLTFNSQDTEEYSKRLAPYLSYGLKGDIPIDTNKDTQLTVNHANVVDLKQINNKRADIYIKVDIEARNVDSSVLQDQVGVNNDKVRNAKIVRYLQVPIEYEDNKLFVYDYPTFVNRTPETKGETAKIPDFPSVDGRLKETIEKMTTDFFKTYSSGSSSQLAVYMLNNQELQGYEGVLNFESLDNIQVIDFQKTKNTDTKTNSDVNEVLVYTTTSWIDPLTNMTSKQHHTFIYKYENDRWLIKQFSGGYKEWRK